MADYQLEIHHIDVTGGDCTLFLIRELVKDTNPIVFSMLVDTGGVGSGPKKLIEYLKYFEKLKKIDLFIASHYHDDHVRGISYYNDKDKKDRSLKFRQVLDIGDVASFCYPTGVKTFDAKAQAMPSYIKKYNAFTREYTLEAGQRVLPPFLDPGTYKEKGQDKKKLVPHELQLTHDGKPTGYSLKIWCGKGVLANGTNVAGEQKTACQVDANDLSIAFTLHGQDGFVYFSAGDLSGDTALAEYRNVEGPLMEYMNGQGLKNISVVKAMHHGSERNNHAQDPLKGKKGMLYCAPGFFESLNPEVVIVPCNQAKQVPAATFISKRLCPYLDKDKSRRAYFLNKVYYRKKSIHSSGLQNLVNTKNSNITFNGAYTISQTASIVVVHQPQKKFQFLEPFKKNCEELSTHGNYTVYRNTAKLESAEVYGGRGGSSHLYNAIERFKVPEIYKGFPNQADEVVKWIVEGFDKNEPSKVAQYLADRFPSLLKAEEYPKDKTQAQGKNFREALISRMESLFKSMFRLPEKPKENSNWEFRFHDGDFSDDDEDTMHSLLVKNRHQLFYALPYGDATGKQVKAFDFSAPFTPDPKIKEGVRKELNRMAGSNKRKSSRIQDQARRVKQRVEKKVGWNG